MRGLWGTTALALVMGGALATGAANAQEVQVADAGEITVTATRSEKDTFDVPSVVSVITAEDIEENLVTDIKDLVRFEPGVSVPTSPSRFSAAFSSAGRDGNSGFNIRGLGGNRVLFQVDGVRVPEGFSFGPASFGRGDYVDLDLLQSVEIMRGPGSALYGSDGLAGVVSFITKDPEDFLYGDESFAARVRASYASADDSFSEGASAAGRWGDWSVIGGYTRRDGHEQDNQGDVAGVGALRTEPNPQDVTSDSAMARLVFEPSDAHRFRLAADWGQREIITESLTARSASVADLDGRDEGERARFGLDYTYENDGGAIDRAFAAIYVQESSLLQFSDEDRAVLADRTRLTTFDNDVWGAALQLESAFSVGNVEHRLIYGGDYSLTRQEGIRDGTVPPGGETFPTRPFPNTDYELAGLFIQDEISFSDGRFVLYPALRYDSYDLQPEDDALYVLPVAGQSDSEITPRLGAVLWASDHVGVFANYARGFRAPSPSEVNNGFVNLAQGYRSEPNPDLTPETSESIEAGVRLRDVRFLGADLRASASAFQSHYEDFIEQAVISGSFTPMDPAVFQYVNLGEVDILGLEGRADLTWENGWGFTAAASIAEGDQDDGAGIEAPLNTIDPLKIVAGLSYHDPNGRFGGQFIATLVAEKDEVDIAQTCTDAFGSSSPCFVPEGFTLLDLTGYWRLTEDATFRVGVFNLTDETYWWWSDARGLDITNVALDAYTQPGRNVSASISYRF
ncbi:TonB-dependent hemoglobin/transferrin/lactoferrin family receptor [Terricaulis silvestris]|uniref:Hemin receptor n=1 Tax=Terricaulis silvestris TaxID=2686094 RepID=A0A6I6MW43_9CAUL|nr:TonB-dependent hemoglobin/transferrin/lactoferrin family receptor [Terricaulis silvestris]QGZ95393.1 Hemin receptor precursor [Terricaulis silvestris]